MAVKYNENVTVIPVSEITPYDGSHKTDDVVSMIEESLKQFGVQQPLVLDGTKTIVAGNALYKAAVNLGLSELPCIVLDNLTDDEIAQYRIADNKTSEFATWNQKKLKQELSYLQSPNELQFCFDENINVMLGFTPMPTFKNATQKQKEEPVKLTPKKPVPTDQQRDKVFKEQLKSVDESLAVKKNNYLEHVCSNCGKTYAVKI